MNSTIERFLVLLESGKDSPLLRYSIGVEFLKMDDVEQAMTHLQAALDADPNHSAAWKVYGKALAMTGEHARARDAFERGICVAEERGDTQAAKEMRVFKRRAERALV